MMNYYQLKAIIEEVQERIKSKGDDIYDRANNNGVDRMAAHLLAELCNYKELWEGCK